MAVTASCGAGYAVRLATRKMTQQSSGSKLILLNSLVSMIACMGGGFANNWFMRLPETKIGIEIQDPSDNKAVGKSKLVAQEAVMQTASSRILLAMPVALPGLIVYFLEKRRLYPKNPAAQLMIQLGLIVAQLKCAVPLAMGAFPQICTIEAARLEPEFQNLRSETTGELIREFRYNKGL